MQGTFLCSVLTDTNLHIVFFNSRNPWHLVWVHNQIVRTTQDGFPHFHSTWQWLQHRHLHAEMEITEISSDFRSAAINPQCSQSLSPTLYPFKQVGVLHLGNWRCGNFSHRCDPGGVNPPVPCFMTSGARLNVDPNGTYVSLPWHCQPLFMPVFISTLVSSSLEKSLQLPEAYHIFLWLLTTNFFWCSPTTSL